MDTSKEEIVNLRKQINRLKISLMFTQVLMIALLLILGYQCLWSIWNYHYLLQQISMCLDSVNTVYSALQQFFASFIEENKQLLSVAYNSMKFEETLVATGGNKKGFIKSPRRLSQQAINSLKEAWRNLYSNNTESVVILNESLDFQEASNTSVEMQLNENKKTNGDEICKVIGIPPSLLSGNAGEQDEKNFIKYELSNLLAEFRTALNRAMLLESEKQMYFFDFDISELIKGDIDKRYNAYSVGIEKGFLQTDEVRKKENMPPLGMKFIKLGLQDGLYDPESNKVIVLNTSKTLDLTKIKEGGDDPGE